MYTKIDLVMYVTNIITKNSSSFSTDMFGIVKLKISVIVVIGF